MLDIASFKDLLKIIPDGLNVIAVLIVMFFFAKREDKFTTAIREIKDDFKDEIRRSQEAFQGQISEITRINTSSQREFQQQLQVLIEAHLTVSRESISALKSFEKVIEGMKDEIKTLQDYRKLYDEMVERVKGLPDERDK